MISPNSGWLLALAASGLLLTGCAEDEVVNAPAPGAPGAGATVRRAAGPAAEAEKPSEKLPTIELDEADFVESDRSRDPFRSYALAFVEEARGAVSSQREVVLEQYALDELTLIAIVGKADPPRAMLVDPSGLGHVILRGQYVGRASVVQPTAGTGASYEVNWRVDRIREGDVVFVRDDPSNPDVPSSTRVVPLRTDDVTVSEEGSSQDDVSSQLAQLKEKLQLLESEDAARARGTTAKAP
jgi:type IV pilus assembly protein PilP